MRDPSTGYAYSYTKVVRLAPGRPEMTIAHRLRNTGTKAITTNVYNHNFVVLDRQPIGPDFVVKFPFPLIPGARGRGPAPTGAAPGASVPTAAAAPPPSPVPGARVVLNNADASCRAENSCAPVGELVGTELRHTKVLEGRERMSTGIGGFSNEVKDYDIRVENAKVGVGFRLTADTPLSRVAYWSIRTVMAVEPYNEMTIPPGAEHAWTLTYTYYEVRSPGGVRGLIMSR